MTARLKLYKEYFLLLSQLALNFYFSSKLNTSKNCSMDQELGKSIYLSSFTLFLKSYKTINLLRFLLRR